MSPTKATAKHTRLTGLRTSLPQLPLCVSCCRHWRRTLARFRLAVPLCLQPQHRHRYACAPLLSLLLLPLLLLPHLLRLYRMNGG